MTAPRRVSMVVLDITRARPRPTPSPAPSPRPALAAHHLARRNSHRLHRSLLRIPRPSRPQLAHLLGAGLSYAPARRHLWHAGVNRVTTRIGPDTPLAPTAAAWRPWTQLEHYLGHPITSTEPALHWLLTTLATTSLSGALLWMIGYAGWLGATRIVHTAARCGYLARVNRGWLALLTLLGAGLTYAQLAAHPITGVHPLVATGALLAAWRAFAHHTNRQARALRSLNYLAARAEFREFKGTESNEQPSTSTAVSALAEVTQ